MATRSKAGLNQIAQSASYLPLTLTYTTLSVKVHFFHFFVMLEGLPSTSLRNKSSKESDISVMQ